MILCILLHSFFFVYSQQFWFQGLGKNNRFLFEIIFSTKYNFLKTSITQFSNPEYNHPKSAAKHQGIGMYYYVPNWLHSFCFISILVYILQMIYIVQDPLQLCILKFLGHFLEHFYYVAQAKYTVQCTGIALPKECIIYVRVIRKH